MKPATRDEILSTLRRGGVVRRYDRQNKMFIRYGRMARALPEEGYVRQASYDRRNWVTWNSCLTEDDVLTMIDFLANQNQAVLAAKHS